MLQIPGDRWRIRVVDFMMIKWIDGGRDRVFKKKKKTTTKKQRRKKACGRLVAIAFKVLPSGERCFDCVGQGKSKNTTLEVKHRVVIDRKCSSSASAGQVVAVFLLQLHMEMIIIVGSVMHHNHTSVTVSTSDDFFFSFISHDRVVPYTS